MLTIRMQRKDRSGHAKFRVIVQDSRFHPSSGRVIAYVGSYNPHTKTAALDGEKISAYLTNGAQPSDRVAKLLQKEGIKLPDWFKASAPKSGKVRNPDKRRSTRPAGAPEPAAKEAAPAAEEKSEQSEAEALAEGPEAAAEPSKEATTESAPIEPEQPASTSKESEP